MGLADQIRTELLSLHDPAYQRFQRSLMPTVPPETVIGVRTPQLRLLAKQLAAEKTLRPFLDALPHAFYEENNLHALLIGQIKAYEACIEAVNSFLPFVDNWATCDMLRPRCFKANRTALMDEIRRWLVSLHPYTVRFALEMLMVHFLDEAFDMACPNLAASIVSDAYYVNMMLAWYFATALAKQWDSIIPFLKQQRLSVWVHDKTIQKAIESHRISPEKKAYLRTLRSRSHAQQIPFPSQP